MSELQRKVESGLTDKDRREIESREAIGAVVVHEAIRREGESELDRPPAALAWSGLAAGLSMGFSMIVQGLLRARLPDAEWTVLVVKLGYPVGFLIVVLGRQQLFTENTLTAVLPVLMSRSGARLLRMLRLWGVVLAGNAAGVVLLDWIAARSAAFSPEVREIFLGMGRDALQGSFGAVLVKALFAGWLIALMVWLIPAAESEKVLVIAAVTYVIGLGRFPHAVAGSIEAFFPVATGALGVGPFLGRYFVPTLLGNVAGGTAFVTLLNHAQVVAGRRRARGAGPGPRPGSAG